MRLPYSPSSVSRLERSAITAERERAPCFQPYGAVGAYGSGVRYDRDARSHLKRATHRGT